MVTLISPSLVGAVTPLKLPPSQVCVPHGGVGSEDFHQGTGTEGGEGAGDPPALMALVMVGSAGGTSVKCSAKVNWLAADVLTPPLAGESCRD